jgi:inorganic pyrophosphatase
MTKNEKYLGRTVHVEIDRPLGTKHPEFGFAYTVNYGYVSGTLSGDGEELDAYVLGIDAPLSEFRGKCIAIIQRKMQDDDKLIVAPEGMDFTDGEIEGLVKFQEKWFEHRIVREQGPP